MKKSTFGLGSGALSLLVFGTCSSLLAKAIYELHGPDLHGHQQPFRKPWASTLGMFIGMLLCLPGAALGTFLRRLLARFRATRTAADAADASVAGAEHESLLSESDQESVDLSAADKAAATTGDSAPAPVKHYALILIPTTFDLVATVLMSVGLLYISASLYQMMRGAEVVFAALFSIAFLGRQLNSHHVGGILLCLVGISVVGVAGALSGKGDVARPVTPSQMVAGMLLVVAAEAVQAAQVVVEDHLLRDVKFDPVTVVGYEGLFGTALLCCVLLPVLQVLPGPEGEGLHEDSRESLHMLSHSRQLQVAFGAYVATIAVYNVAGMLVTDSLGAVTRTVLETLRTLFVWLLDLLIYYAAPLGPGGALGEPWSRFSWLQAIGFLILVLGTLVYGRGDELQEEELRRYAKRRARQRWGKIRASLPDLVQEAQRRLTPEERAPMRAPRIAGPARIRTALLPVLFVHRLQGLSRPRWGAVAAWSSHHLPDAAHERPHHPGGSLAGHSRRSSLDNILDIHPHDHRQPPHQQQQRQRPPSRPASHPHSLAEAVEEAVAATRE